jgi:preprotein translocase subunit SecG
MTTFFYFFVITLFMLLSALLCFVILIQEGKSTGLGASFGGDTGESVFGTQTADVLKKFTAWLAVLFMGGCLLLSFWTSALGRAKTPQVNPYNTEQAEFED